jgi:hypothetical protein
VSASLSQTLAAISAIAASFLLVGLATTAAPARSQGEHLDADLSSVIRADYSADPHGATRAPLSERIVDAARVDENTLQETIPEIETVPIFRPLASPRTDDGAEPPRAATPAASPIRPSRTPAFDMPEASHTPPPAPARTPTPEPTHAPRDCQLLRRECPAPTPAPTEAPRDGSEDMTTVEVTE